jgi:hypothetical protein
VSCTPDTNFETASKDQMEAFNELQRLSGSPECAARYLETVADLDVRELLSQVRAPTLVMHVRDDQRVPSDLGRELAAGITGARFVAPIGEESCPVGARPRPAPLLRGTERLFDGRILAARRLAGALIGGMKFSYAMSVQGEFPPKCDVRDEFVLPPISEMKLRCRE